MGSAGKLCGGGTGVHCTKLKINYELQGNWRMGGKRDDIRSQVWQVDKISWSGVEITNTTSKLDIINKLGPMKKKKSPEFFF